jgi:hypothetical protein
VSSGGDDWGLLSIASAWERFENGPEAPSALHFVPPSEKRSGLSVSKLIITRKTGMAFNSISTEKIFR